MATPFVTIKKKDGSYKKVPLSDFKVPAKKIEPVQKPILSRSVGIKKTVSSLPIKPQTPKIIPSPIKPTNPLDKKSTTSSLNREDFTSPLEEKLTESTNSEAPLISKDRLGEVDEIIKQLSFKINPPSLFRLRNILQQRLKEIRSEEETKHILLAKENEGGLQLNEKHAEEILRKCADLLLPQLYHDAAPFDKIQSTFSTKKNVSLEKNEKISQPISPLKLSVLPEPKKKFSLPIQEEEPIFSLKTSKTHAKPIVTDIVTKSLEVGPVEEIEYLTLTDFRRLAPNPSEAALRLGQKIINLKNESIILYLESIDAWKKSPLYAEYINAISKALAQYKKLADVTVDKQAIQFSEISALITMEKETITI